MHLAFFLNYWVILLSALVVAQIFSPFVDLARPIKISTREVKSEMETHPITTEAKMTKCSI